MSDRQFYGRNFGRRRNTLTPRPVSAQPPRMIILYVAAGAAGLLFMLSFGAGLVRLAARYWWLCLALAIVVAAGVATAADRTKPTLADERNARPACVGIVGDKAWADCMAKFKDVRPQHAPTTLQFKDWRT